MHPRSIIGDQARLSLLHRLATVAGAVVAGLVACGALLAALGGPVPSAAAAPASGPVIYPGGAGCTTTLQACIDNSPAGATIVVQPNNYFTNGLTLNKAVSLTGVSSATVILHALVSQRVLTVTGAAVNSSVIISGLTLAGGHAVGGSCPAGCGGAILITGTAQPLLINLTITNNAADWQGGGVYAAAGSPLALSGVALLNNASSSNGGGAAGENVTLTGGLVRDNQCVLALCSGGGLTASNSLIATGAAFLSNTSAANGGGAFAVGNITLTGGSFQNNKCTHANCLGGGLMTRANLSVTGTVFVSNTSLRAGGGAYAFSLVTLNGATFQNNHCLDSSCGSGGLEADGNLTATSTSFVSNTSVSSAGGLFVAGDALVSGGLFQANRCTDPGCSGGGMFVQGSLSLSDTQFLSNTAIGLAGGAVAVVSTWITGGLFQGNTCTGPSCAGAGLGGGVSLSVSGTRFVNNQCSGSNCLGGGLWANGALNVTGAQFLSNSATSQGGGLFAAGAFAVTNTVFLSNTAQTGAGLYHSFGDGRLVNNLFAANEASSHGDALALASPGAVDLRHNTLVGPVFGFGDLVYVTSGTVVLTNTLITSDAVGIDNAGGKVHEDYTLFSGVNTHFSGPVGGGGGSLSGPANFTNPAAGPSGYHLGHGSAAIDAGVDAGISSDIDGEARPMGSGFDIGFDEATIRRLFLPLLMK